MRLLSLLFDPRGAIDRRTYWSGLLQLTMIGLMLGFGLAPLGPNVASAALPAVGEAFVVAGVVSQVYGSSFPDVVLVASIVVAAARLYVLACLMVKRSRDAGEGPRPLIAFGLAGLLVQALMGLWMYDLFGEDMAVLVPMAVDAAITAALGLGFTIRLGVLRSCPARGPARGLTG